MADDEKDDEQLAALVAAVAKRFRTFGGDRDPGNNPIAHAEKGKPPTFAAGVDVAAAGVDVADVVAFVLEQAPCGDEVDDQAKRAMLDMLNKLAEEVQAGEIAGIGYAFVRPDHSIGGGGFFTSEYLPAMLGSLRVFEQSILNRIDPTEIEPEEVESVPDSQKH